MNYQDFAQKKEDGARKVPALVVAEIVMAVAQYSAKHMAAGQEALKRAVSFGVMDHKPTRLFKRLRRLGTKADQATIAWLVGPLDRAATSVYVDNKNRLLLTTAFHVPRDMSEIILVTRESLSEMNPDEAMEIYALFVKRQS